MDDRNGHNQGECRWNALKQAPGRVVWSRWFLTAGAILFTIAAAVGACDSTETLCDGTAGHRLLVIVGPDGNGSNVALSGFALLVDGNCRYWVESSLDPRGSGGTTIVKTGTLEPQEGEALARDLRFGKWSSWKGAWNAEYLADFTPYTFSNGRDVVMYGYGNRAERSQKSDFDDMLVKLQEWRIGLFKKGTPSVGDMRITAQDLSLKMPKFRHARAVSWVLDRPVSLFVGHRPEERISLKTFRISDASELTALRIARSTIGDCLYVHDPRVGPADRPLDEVDYCVYMRDVSPTEDADGTIITTWER